MIFNKQLIIAPTCMYAL